MDYGWIKHIDYNLTALYPIQFANCDRLDKNNAVYIFDEVGSGKTISSGLMALHYLFNNKDKKVLIITINALIDKKNPSNGQFLRDWYEKLPFKQLELDNRITIINNHPNNIEKVKSDTYGLVIIDEAHLFLNPNTSRYWNLSRGIRSEKVVFLTATPIKNSKADLQVYVNLATDIVGEQSNEWIDKIYKDDTVISSQFNIESPVTRYFKDTIKALNQENSKKTVAMRMTAHIWKFGTQYDKDDTLIGYINKLEKTDKFLIFTRFVEDEALRLGKFFENNGYKEFSEGDSSSERTYKVITGKNSEELRNYEKREENKLPKILIITYQIAEQGVNFPQYNYVVNYHISAFPSALEQRFGRVDRLNSESSKIHMCYLIQDICNGFDYNTVNFYIAIRIYLQELLSYLPVRNVILSKKVFELCIKKQLSSKELDRYIECNFSDGELEKAIQYYKNNTNEENSIAFEFIQAYEGELKSILNEGEYKEYIREKVREKYLELLSDNNSINRVFEVLEHSGDDTEVVDDILYKKNDRIQRINAITGCAEEICKNEKYKKYKEIFDCRTKVSLPELYNRYQNEFKSMNTYFEEAFINNQFCKIFPQLGYESIFKQQLASKISNLYDMENIIDNCNDIVFMLPFFKMCMIFKHYIQLFAYLLRFDVNPFYVAFYKTFEELELHDFYGLSKIVNKYFKDYEVTDPQCGIRVYSDCCEKWYRLEEKDGVIDATNWLKLAYYYTRKEEIYILHTRFRHKSSSNNKERLQWDLNKFQVEYERYTSDYANYDYKCKEFTRDGEDIPKEILAEEPEEPDYEKIEQSENALKKIEYNEKMEQALACSEGGSIQSLFHYYFWANRTRIREYMKEIFDKNRLYFDSKKSKDEWTKQIIKEIYGIER